MSNADSKTVEVGAVLYMGGLYGRVAVQVVRASDLTVEFKFVGKTGTQIMERATFCHKVSA